MNKRIREAVKVFKKGGIVIFPTDTAIGVGCRIDNKESIKRLFKIRKRPENKPMLVLVNSVKMAKSYLLSIPQDVEDRLVNAYWPGKLTIILKCNPNKVPFPVRDKRGTLGVRFPNNKMLLELINEVGVPIVAPSANFGGEKTPFKFEDLNPELIKQVNYVLREKVDSETNVSTVIDCTVTPWKTIRQGAIKIQNVTLLIDTSDNTRIIVGLILNGKKHILIEKITPNKEQIILPMIDRILKKHLLKPENLSGIQVNTGPGSFTGLRVGLAIVNVLSLVLKIPVNGKKVGRIISPIYK